MEGSKELRFAEKREVRGREGMWNGIIIKIGCVSRWREEKGKRDRNDAPSLFTREQSDTYSFHSWLEEQDRVIYSSLASTFFTLKKRDRKMTRRGEQNRSHTQTFCFNSLTLNSLHADVDDMLLFCTSFFSSSLPPAAHEILVDGEQGMKNSWRSVEESLIPFFFFNKIGFSLFPTTLQAGAGGSKTCFERHAKNSFP